MSLARSKLYVVESERRQNTVEDSAHLADDIFPLPLPLKPGAKSELACAGIYGLNLFACGKAARGKDFDPNVSLVGSSKTWLRFVSASKCGT